jgi:formylglycine-generating enzyme required for sulfatase activity
MIWIPGGSFVMGSPGSSTNIDERPSHTVKIKKFAISKFEVTFSEYEKYAKATKNPMPDDLYMEHETSPVIFVKWDDAFNYAKWLSEQTGQKYRLPSEAEWEYAAAGGRDTPFWWGYEEKPGMAHCFACESQFDPRKPAKIGQFPANPYGLYDISGNVSEWVYDCWHDSYKDAPSDGSVWEGGDCSQRIARGGSYISPQQSLRVAKRDKFKSDSGYDHVGIRLARDE